MTAVRSLGHAGVAVRDLERALRFYRDALGLEVLFSGETESPHLAQITGQPVTKLRKANVAIPGGEAYIELLEWSSPDPRSGAARPTDWGVGHICLIVDDVDAVLERLRDHGFPAWVERGTRVESGPNRGGGAAYARDADGYTVELLDRPGESTILP